MLNLVFMECFCCFFSVFENLLKMWNCFRPEHSGLTPGNVQILLLCRSERRRCYITSFGGAWEAVLELLGVGAGGSLVPFFCLMHQMCRTSCTCLDTQGVGFRFGCSHTLACHFPSLSCFPGISHALSFFTPSQLVRWN